MSKPIQWLPDLGQLRIPINSIALRFTSECSFGTITRRSSSTVFKSPPRLTQSAFNIDPAWKRYSMDNRRVVSIRMGPS